MKIKEIEKYVFIKIQTKIRTIWTFRKDHSTKMGGNANVLADK